MDAAHIITSYLQLHFERLKIAGAVLIVQGSLHRRFVDPELKTFSPTDLIC